MKKELASAPQSPTFFSPSSSVHVVPSSSPLVSPLPSPLSSASSSSHALTAVPSFRTASALDFLADVALGIESSSNDAETKSKIESPPGEKQDQDNFKPSPPPPSAPSSSSASSVHKGAVEFPSKNTLKTHKSSLKPKRAPLPLVRSQPPATESDSCCTAPSSEKRMAPQHHVHKPGMHCAPRHQEEYKHDHEQQHRAHLAQSVFAPTVSAPTTLTFPVNSSSMGHPALRTSLPSPHDTTVAPAPSRASTIMVRASPAALPQLSSIQVPHVEHLQNSHTLMHTQQSQRQQAMVLAERPHSSQGDIAFLLPSSSAPPRSLALNSSSSSAPLFLTFGA